MGPHFYHAFFISSPKVLSLASRLTRSLRKNFKALELKKGMLFQGVRRILLPHEICTLLQDLHEKVSHTPSVSFYHLARDFFVLPYSRIECRETGNCRTSADSRIPIRKSGPMVRCARKKRKSVC